ncbi:hypothetical protein R1sor_017344 [Riccia sorocarpa]|uniref:tRNA N(3)-methylcytidine methyltransferase n=1 Tax=Riccia sorocarpa TaxID=122646 RepID=A0ABD3I9C6_9MARC
MESEREQGGVDMGSVEDDARDSSARAFYSSDFEWEELREEIEGTGSQPHETTEFETIILEAQRRAESGRNEPVFSPSAWESFHKNHSNALFFKERRYLVKEFPELISGSRDITVLEVGCGTGSSVVPILRANGNATCYGCDCSAAALDRAKLLVADQAGLSESQKRKFHPFQCDISVEAFPSWLCCSSCRSSNQTNGLRDKKIEAGVVSSSAEGSCCIRGVSFVMLIFTLSAIPLEKMRHVVAECAAVLRPGGLLLFRDYGLYDMTMLRFPSSQKVAERLYYRKDGTLSYFFSSGVVRELFTGVGLLEEELHYCCVKLLNRRKQVPMKRVWVHAKFRKPLVEVSADESVA